MSEYTNIYVLVSSKDLNTVRYVGKTNGYLKQRLYAHVHESRKGVDTFKCRWIRKQLREGYKIHIKLIDVVYKSDWQFWEIFWIAEYKRRGCFLTNTSMGGDGENDGKGKPVVLLNKSGKYIKEFKSIAQAAAFIGVLDRQVGNVASLNNSKKSIKGYQVIYSHLYNADNNYNITPKYKQRVKPSLEERLNSWKLNSLKAGEKTSKRISRVALDGEILETYKNVTQAAANTDYTVSGIRKCLYGTRGTHKGFIWKYV